MRKLLLAGLLLLSLGAQAQEKVLVHINAEFNKSNDWYGLKIVQGARVFNGYIEQAPRIKEKYKITKVPTLILYIDGKEEHRWEAALDMKLHVNVNQIQNKIDNE
jgi:hypothetical protein